MMRELPYDAMGDYSVFKKDTHREETAGSETDTEDGDEKDL